MKTINKMNEPLRLLLLLIRRFRLLRRPQEPEGEETDEINKSINQSINQSKAQLHPHRNPLSIDTAVLETSGGADARNGNSHHVNHVDCYQSNPLITHHKTLV